MQVKKIDILYNMSIYLICPKAKNPNKLMKGKYMPKRQTNALLEIWFKIDRIFIIVVVVALFFIGVLTRDKTTFPYILWGTLVIFIEVIGSSINKFSQKRTLQQEGELIQKKKRLEILEQKRSQNRTEKVQATMELANRHETKEIR